MLSIPQKYADVKFFFRFFHWEIERSRGTGPRPTGTHTVFFRTHHS